MKKRQNWMIDMALLYKLMAYVLIVLCCIYIIYEIDKTREYLNETEDSIPLIVCVGIVKGLWIGLALGITKEWVDSLELMYHAIK